MHDNHLNFLIRQPYMAPYPSPLLCVQCFLRTSSSAADYDLTGQIIWPAATLLADYLGERPNIMTGRRAACELGSGVGLTGLVCGQFCNTVLTDHNKIVLKVLQENVGRNPSQHKVRYFCPACYP